MSGQRFELERVEVMPVPIDRAFAFFAEPANLEVITPPWLGFHIVEAPPAITAGSLLAYHLRLFGVPVRWLTEITEWVEGRSFTDVQLRGPYAEWAHTHRFVEVSGGTEIYDHVGYRLPLGRVGEAVRHLAVARLLDEIFDFRAQATRAALS